MQVCTRYWAVIQPQGASQGQPLVDGEEEEGGELEEGEEVRSVCWGPLEGGGEPPTVGSTPPTECCEVTLPLPPSLSAGPAEL